MSSFWWTKDMDNFSVSNVGNFGRRRKKFRLD